MVHELEINFQDLTDDFQQEVLSFYGIKTPEEANIDVYPVTTLYSDIFSEIGL